MWSQSALASLLRIRSVIVLSAVNAFAQVNPDYHKQAFVKVVSSIGKRLQSVIDTDSTNCSKICHGVFQRYEIGVLIANYRYRL